MSEKRFQVALSFPGEHRDYVLQVAELLAETLGRDVILYDAWYKAEFTRPNLDKYLQNLYHNESILLVPFLCADYEAKDWCQLEWRVIRNLIKRRQDQDIMPMRFDGTDIDGLFDIDGYLDLNDHEPQEVADLILQRLPLMGVLPPDNNGAEAPQKNIQIDRLPTVAGDFFGREYELELLDTALEKSPLSPLLQSGEPSRQSGVNIEGPPTLQKGERGGFQTSAAPRIIQFIASGGTGKTKLLRHWLNQHQDTIGNYIIWSFYSQGTSDSKQVSATPLFTEAFKAFGVDYEQYRTDEDRADAFADLLIEHQSLLVLDGLEPLQHGGAGFDGQLKDRAMKRLLQKLAQGHTNLCITTTRINLHELKDRAHVISHPLDNLSTDDGVKLLRSWDVQGTDKDMQESGQQHHLPRGLLARASLYRNSNKFNLAHQDLAEVQEIAEPSEMRLHITDYHLEMARLLLAKNPPRSPFCKGGGHFISASESDRRALPFEKGETEGILFHVTQAEKLIQATGYHRRDQELADLKTQLNP